MLANVQIDKKIHGLTRYNITSVHSIFVLDEAEAIHELDLGDLARPMGAEVFFDILFGHCKSSTTRLARHVIRRGTRPSGLGHEWGCKRYSY